MKTRIQHFDGAEAKMNRLGLGPLLTEIEQMLQNHLALLAEEKQANGAAELREQLDGLF